MNIKALILKHYIQGELLHVIGYDFFVYLACVLKFLIGLFLAAVVYLICSLYFNSFTLSLIFGVIGIVLYVRMMIQLMNKYLDGVILTHMGIVVFYRNGLLEYKTETFERNKIETTSHEQSTFLSGLLNRGLLSVALDAGSFSFGYISNPKKHVDKILQLKHFYQQPVTQTTVIEEDKFNALVETLGEVIIDYMNKEKK